MNPHADALLWWYLSAEWDPQVLWDIAPLFQGARFGHIVAYNVHLLISKGGKEATILVAVLLIICMRVLQ
jgi:hypothetical protein